MGLYIRQDDRRSELQERVAAELQEKARKRAQQDNERPDGVSDSQYIKGTTGTTRYAWVWIVIIAAIVIGVVVTFIATRH